MAHEDHFLSRVKSKVIRTILYCITAIPLVVYQFEFFTQSR